MWKKGKENLESFIGNYLISLNNVDDILIEIGFEGAYFRLYFIKYKFPSNLILTSFLLVSDLN